MTARAIAALLTLAALAACEPPPRAGGFPTMAIPAPEPTASAVATTPPASPTPAPATSQSPPAAVPAAVSVAPSPSPSPLRASPAPAPTPSPAAATGLMVPLYTRPTHASWDDLIALRQRHPAVGVVAIVNPASGPGVMRDPAYVAGIDRLVAAGVRVIGYVATGYGANPANAIALDLARWRQHYPAADGVFLDEVPTSAAQRFHYGQIVADARRRGFKWVVGNPGISTDVAFAELLDVLIAYEQPGWPGPDEPSAELAARFGKHKFGMLAYETPTFTAASATAAASRFGWLYVTEDAEPNPWDTLSGHAEAIAESLD